MLNIALHHQSSIELFATIGAILVSADKHDDDGDGDDDDDDDDDHRSRSDSLHRSIHS